MRCSCCGEERDAMQVASLSCRPDVHLCGGCVGSLAEKVGLLDVTPTLPVVDMDEAVVFYEAAGFDVRVYEGGGFAFVQHLDQSVFDLGLEVGLDPASNRSGCYIIVPAPDDWHERFVQLGCHVSDVVETEYGMREFTLDDPSGNRLRFGHSA